MKTSLTILACTLLLTAPAHAAKAAKAKEAEKAPAPVPFTQDNTFASESSLPYHLPPFDRIGVADYRPAFEAGMAEQRREVDALTRSAEPATFENTIVALERSGELLARVSSVFFNMSASNSSPEIEKIEQEVAPKLSAHRDSIFLEAALYARVKSLYDDRASLGLDPESLRLLERYHTEFVRAGAALSEADKTKLKKLNEEESSLTTTFQQNVLKATNANAVVVDKVEDLDGLTPEQIAAAAEAAKSRKLAGKWVLTLQNTTGQPVLVQLKNRALRERVYKASTSRGVGGDADNTVVAAKLVKLRAERAVLLGYPSHAAYRLEDETAGTTAAVNKMLADLAPATLANTKKEAAEIQKVIDEQERAAGREPFPMAPWDWAFYSEQVRQAKFSFDQAQVRPYFELDRVLVDGAFYAMHELYGVSFKERFDLPVYEPTVRVFEVFNEDGSQLGLFLADYFARDNKQGGAWMNEYVSQSRLMGRKPVVVNNLNIVKPPAGQPVLLTPDEVQTLFHELGHGMHGLFSSVQYPLFAGTAVPRDFVEYPSQYNEMWASEPKVLAHYAKHYQTGEPIPKALMDKILAAGTFNQGFETLEYLESSIFDQAMHQITPNEAPAAKDILAFEAQALQKAGVAYDLVPPRYHTTYYLHIFSNDYSAGYYSYLWSDVLAKDTQHWFETHGGLQRANGDFLRAKVLSRGFSADSVTLFKEFYGGDPDVRPLLEHRGLAAPAETAAN